MEGARMCFNINTHVVARYFRYIKCMNDQEIHKYTVYRLSYASYKNYYYNAARKKSGLYLLHNLCSRNANQREKRRALVA